MLTEVHLSPQAQRFRYTCVCPTLNFAGLWQELLDDCLQHLEPEVQNAAVAAIPSFFTQYYSRPDGSAVAEMQGEPPVNAESLKECSMTFERKDTLLKFSARCVGRI